MATANTVPKLRVQRMGAKWRIVHEDSRCLARFTGKNGKPGEPVDGGGFEDVWEGEDVISSGQTEAYKRLSTVMSGLEASDPDEENVGP